MQNGLNLSKVFSVPRWNVKSQQADTFTVTWQTPDGEPDFVAVTFRYCEDDTCELHAPPPGTRPQERGGPSKSSGLYWRVTSVTSRSREELQIYYSRATQADRWSHGRRESVYAPWALRRRKLLRPGFNQLHLKRRTITNVDPVFISEFSADANWKPRQNRGTKAISKSRNGEAGVSWIQKSLHYYETCKT